MWGRTHLVAAHAEGDAARDALVLQVPLLHHLADGKAGLDDGKVAVRVRPAIVDELEVVHVGRGPVHGAARGADQQVEQPAVVLLRVQQRELVAVVHGKQVF